MPCQLGNFVSLKCVYCADEELTVAVDDNVVSTAAAVSEPLFLDPGESLDLDPPDLFLSVNRFASTQRRDTYPT